MPTLIYLGPADHRGLSSEDLKSLGVEGAEDHEFRRGLAQDVDADVAEVLLSDSRLKGQFASADKVNEETASRLQVQGGTSGVFIDTDSSLQLEEDDDQDDDDEVE